MKKYKCVVHQPKQIFRDPKHFQSPPRTVTEVNKSFWNGDAPLGGSICKDCYSEYNHRPQALMGSVETSPVEHMV